jgi:hypothetical protein
MTNTTPYRILSRLVARWAAIIAIAAVSFACESRVVVGATTDSGVGGTSGGGGAGGRIAQETGGFQATGGTSTGGAGTGGASPSGGGSVARVHDPCNAVGQIYVRHLGHDMEVTETPSVYVVAFDPPRLLGTKALEPVFLVNGERNGWEATIERAELEGTPSCEVLRGSLVFIAGVDQEGTVWVEEGDINASGTASYCTSLRMNLDPSVGAVDQVRAFGMVLGESQIEGPRVAERNSSPGSWDWVDWRDPEGFQGCTPGYVVMMVAHRGNYLAASAVSAVPMQ